MRGDVQEVVQVSCHEVLVTQRRPMHCVSLLCWCENMGASLWLLRRLSPHRVGGRTPHAFHFWCLPTVARPMGQNHPFNFGFERVFVVGGDVERGFIGGFVIEAFLSIKIATMCAP